YLPQTEGAPSDAATESVVTSGDGQGVILLVEDEPEVGALAEEFLVSGGYRVLQADTPAAALATVRQLKGRLDLLLTDVIMPCMPCNRLRDAIVAVRPNVSVLYMTGYAAEALAERGVLLPGVQLIEKPFTRTQLLTKVGDVLTARGGHPARLSTGARLASTR